MSSTPPAQQPDDSSDSVALRKQSVTVDFDILPAEIIKELIANPDWSPIDDELHELVMSLPRTANNIERTTILTWMYQNNGVITFGDLVDMIKSNNKRKLKKNLRQVLRNLEELQLVSFVNFPDPEKGVTIEDNVGVVGRQTMLTICWAGMVWLRRAWLARQRMIGKGTLMYVHQVLTEEEDEGKKNSPAWIENIVNRQTSKAQESKTRSFLAMRSVFDMAQSVGDEIDQKSDFGRTSQG